MGKAGEGIRTLDIHVGNVTLYQLSYARTVVTAANDTPRAEAGKY